MLGASITYKLKLLTLTLHKPRPQVVKGSKITSLLLKLKLYFRQKCCHMKHIVQYVKDVYARVDMSTQGSRSKNIMHNGS